MAYDPKQRVTVLYGGYGQRAGEELQDTWTWDGSVWRLLPIDSPPSRANARMVHDSSLRHLILFGGSYSNPNYQPGGCTPTGTLCQYIPRNDIWVWDGTWKFVANADLSITAHAMAYDSRRRQVVVFGGDIPTEYPPISSPCRSCRNAATDQTWVLELSQAWVDFSYVGPETGSFAAPFNDLLSAVNSAVPRSVINFKPGSGLAPFPINKALILDAPLGPVTIGR